jgi:hypothetical protein
LSLRDAMNTGWRINPSRVHSAKLISATRLGEIQCAGVSVFGGSRNGDVLRANGSIVFAMAVSLRPSKPVPTEPP